MDKSLTADEFVAAQEAARERLEKHVSQLAHSREIEVSVELQRDVRPGIYRISLRRGQREIFVSVAEDTFLNPGEFFAVFVLPRIRAAIGKLAAQN